MCNFSPLMSPLLFCIFALLASPTATQASPAGPSERRATVFYSAETHGTLEPCGCTSNPLGDISRVTALVRRAAAKGAALFVDGGNLSYPSRELAARKQEGADLVASFLAREFVRLPLGGVGLGAADVVRGASLIQPKRLAANFSESSFVQPSVMKQIGGIQVGVMGVADPALARPLGVQAEDPVAAARAEAERLRTKGAEVVIALAPLDRSTARAIARSAKVDFVVLGQEVGEGQARAERVGNAYLLTPSAELEHLGKIEIVLRGARQGQDPLVDAGGPAANLLRLEEVERRLKQIESDLAKWDKDGSADAGFVAGKRKERDNLGEERLRLKQPWQPPSQGSYFTDQLIPIQRNLPRDPALAASMRQLDKQVGAATLRASQPPPEAEPGRAHYVGDTSCVRCHKAAARFGKHTAHAKAWPDLVKVGKEAHEDCVSCHVVGFGEVGGTSVGFTKGREGVQCEACHGPGSIHVEKKGREKPLAIRTKTPESVCTRCHNEKHSDTFEYKAYLRDIIGPGHGEDAYDDLGPGPTAHELRQSASKRARAEARQASR